MKFKNPNLFFLNGQTDTHTEAPSTFQSWGLCLSLIKVVFVNLTLRQLNLYNDLCKQFGPILGPTKYRDSPTDLDHNGLIHSFSK